MKKFNDISEEIFENTLLNILKNKFPKGEYEITESKRKSKTINPDAIVRKKAVDDIYYDDVVLYFEAYHPNSKKVWLPTIGGIHDGKIDQMRKYQRCAPSFLVIPNDRIGFTPFSFHSGFFVITLDYLPDFVDFLLPNIEKLREEYPGITHYSNYFKFFSKFLVKVGERIQRCTNCKSKMYGIDLYYCKENNFFLYPDFLDEYEEEGKGIFNTGSECNDCKMRYIIGSNYTDCESGEIVGCLQCVDCGAVHDINLKIIKNFHYAHMTELKLSFTYYDKL